MTRVRLCTSKSVLWHDPEAGDSHLCSLRSRPSLWVRSTWNVPLRYLKGFDQLPASSKGFLRHSVQCWSLTPFKLNVASTTGCRKQWNKFLLWQIMHIIMSGEYEMPFNHEGSRNLKDQTKPELKSLCMKQFKRSVCVLPIGMQLLQFIHLASVSLPDCF